MGRISLKVNDLTGNINAAWNCLNDEFKASAKASGRGWGAKPEIQEHLAKASTALTEMIEPDWRLVIGGTPQDESKEDAWRRLAGLFLASRILDYSRYVLAQLRNLLAFSTAGAILMLIGISSYPFPNNDTILRFGWMVLLALVIVGIWVFVQINKDRLLSLLTAGTPGKIDWNSGFIGHIAVYALLPILTILGIRFPATFSGIVSSIASLLPGAHS